MTNKDGIEVFSVLRRHPELSKVPVVVTTNLSMTERDMEEKLGGARHYLIKANISIKELIELVEKELAEQSQS